MMPINGHIDMDGRLWIERAGRTRLALCRGTQYPCCDACSLFGEPEYIQGIRHIDKSNKPELFVHLELCHKTLVFGCFQDRR